MIQDRRVMISVASLLFSLVSVAGAAVSPAFYRPDPHCGDYVDDCPKPSPLAMRGFSVRVASLNSAIADGKMAKASEGLEGLFSGSGVGSESNAVVDGYPSPSRRRTGSKGGFVKAGWKGCVGGYLAGGAGGCGIGSAAEDGFNAGMDNLGDRLRDRNDDKLKK